MNTDPFDREMKIAVAGTGYVGLNIAVLLAQHNRVTAVDIVPEKVDMLSRRQSPIRDEYIEIPGRKAVEPRRLRSTVRRLCRCRLRGDRRSDQLRQPEELFRHFGCRAVIRLVMASNPDAVMVIKSTVPVGYTEASAGCSAPAASSSRPSSCASKALYDNLYPSPHHRRPARRGRTAGPGGACLCGAAAAGGLKESVETLSWGRPRRRR